MKIKPGEIVIGEPEYIGSIPIRQDLEILERPKDYKSPAEQEFEQHKSIALRVPMSYMDPRDNTLDDTWRLMEDAIVLIARQQGGFSFCPLEKDRKGWFLRLKEDISIKSRVEFCNDRKRWVIRELV
jgi:hypothetical protein